MNGDAIMVRKSIMATDLESVNSLKTTLTNRELNCMEVVKCKSHLPMLLCVVNSSQSLKKHFCETMCDDVITSFFSWIVSDVLKPMNKKRDQKNDYVFVAHNGSAYDSQFIYKHAHEYFGSRNVQVLMHNNRMIELKLQVNMGFQLAAIYFKDSYKFINLPLCLLPKSFGFHNELQKRFFPHDLNTKENLQYVSDSLPDAIYFGINDMTSDERIRFLSWYDSEKLKYETNDSLSYNLHERMIKYCYDDCFVLAAAFTKFNESMILELRSTGVEGIIDHDYTILADFITLPQMVIHWFMGCMMKEHEISVVPAGSYSSGKCGSLKERIWLAYFDKIHMEEEGDDFIPITSRYCSGVGQHRVGDFFLDGFRTLPSRGREFY